jgi:hypothetical protein
MNLVKWLRKNNKKIMAVVVIVLMVGFIGGSALSYLLNPGKGDKAALGYYGNHKVRIYDREVARQELEILQSIGVPRALQNSYAGLLLSQLLFPSERISGDLAATAQRAVQQNAYRVSNRQLADIFNERSSFSPEILWILLRDEALAAGMHAGIEEARSNLSSMLDPKNGGPGYARGMQNLVNRYRIPEDEVLRAFGKLMAVFEYGDYICANENMTTAQLRHLVSAEGEGLDAEFVQFKASDFVDKQMVPSESDMQAQFEKYKAMLAGQVSEANPFGFGYKLPDRIQAEYIVVKLDDIQTIVKKPTRQEAETYYQQNRETQFTTQVPTDPNNPKSPTKQQVQSYSEVADSILKQLAQEKVAAKAEQILTEARDLADVRLPASSSDTNEPNATTLKPLAGNYGEIAQKLSEKYKISVLSGRTGFVTAADIQSDKQFGRLRLASGAGASSISASQALFSVSDLGDRAIVLLSSPATKMYRTIGPLRDAGMTGVMAVARVINVEKAAEPANLNVAYSITTMTLSNTSKEDANSVYSVKDQVSKDLKVLAAWDKTKAKAQELVELSSKEGWGKAVTKFNDLYGKDLKKDPNDPNVFRVDRRNGVQRITEAQAEVYTAQLSNSPNGRLVLNRMQTQKLLAERLFSLVPADANTAPKMPAVMEFKPDQSFYALKTVTVQRVNQQQFQEMKNTVAFRNESTETQSLMTVHYDPQNIVKRMKFKYAEEGANRRVAAPPISPEDEF